MSRSSNSKSEALQEGRFSGRLGVGCLIGLVIAGYVCLLGRRVVDLDLVTVGSIFMGLAFGVLMGYSLAVSKFRTLR